MDIYLIRHTQVDVEKGVCYGHKDVALAQSYQEELQEVQKKLQGIDFDVIFSSPLTRCKQLAQDLNRENVIYDDRLKELNFGDWEGKEWDEIADPAFELWMNDFVNRKCTNGESFTMLQQRVESFWKELANQNHHSVAIITHGGVIRTIQAMVKNLKLEEAFNEPPADFGEVIKITL